MSEEEAIKYSIGHITKQHLSNYFFNAYDKEKLKKREKPKSSEEKVKR